MKLTMRFDMRTPDPATDRAAFYASAIEMCEWADRLGFDDVCIGEHHDEDAGFMPQPIVMASAIAARTKQIKLHLSALLVTMQPALALAEQLAVLDIVSNGRVKVTAGIGYRPHEFAMFGVDMERKLEIFLETLDVLKKAWTGEYFEYQGRRVRVTPKPVTPGGPRILMGGSTHGSARRAARLGHEYLPGAPVYYETYRQELAKLGKPEPPPLSYPAPFFLYVTEDPEKYWPILGPHILYTTNSYAKWAAERGSGSTLYMEVKSIDELRDKDIFKILTPEQCVEFARSLGPHGDLMFHPLFGGIDQELAWRSLQLFEEKVLPRLKEEGIRAA